MINLNKFTKLIINPARLLLTQPQYFIHHTGESLPRQYNHKFTPQEKKILYGKGHRIIPQVEIQYNDVLIIPGYDKRGIGELYAEYLARKVPLSPEHLCALIYMFIKNSLMSTQVFDQLEKNAYRHKGEYKTRSIFGALQGSLLFNRKNLIEFFLQQYEASSEQFTFEQAILIIQALNKNKSLDQDEKKTIYSKFLKPLIVDCLSTFKNLPTEAVVRMFDGLQEIDEKDKQIQKQLIKRMKGKKGWERIPIIERLYKISGRSWYAKKIFDNYFEAMSQQHEIISRYNLTELRYHTPLELIKFAQENPSDYYPKIRTLIPQKYNAEQWNKKYERFISIGAVKEEQQILKDKARSFGYAIKQRYQALKNNNQDFTKMSRQEFEQLFGSYEEAIDTIKIEDEKIAQSEQEQQQQQQQHEQAEEDEGKPKGKKAKGGDKKQGEQTSKEKKPKQKKQKSSTPSQ